MYCCPPSSLWQSECVCSCTCEWAPLSQRWAVWSSCRCRKVQPPREPHASQLREKYPGSCHVSSGFYGNQWSSDSVDNGKENNCFNIYISDTEFRNMKQLFYHDCMCVWECVSVLIPGSSGAGWGWGRTHWRLASGPWCCGVCSALPATGGTWSCVSAGQAERCSRAEHPVKTATHSAAWQNVSGLLRAFLQVGGQENNSKETFGFCGFCPTYYCFYNTTSMLRVLPRNF